MKFSHKVFLAIFSLVAVVLVASEILILRSIASQTEREYVKRYSSLSRQIGDTLTQIDKTTDLVMQNALRVLRERERASGLPSNAELKKLAAELGVTILYITDARGRFIRSGWYMDVAASPRLQAFYKGASPLSRPLFSYCGDYKELITGRIASERTPLVPSNSGGWTDKYLMMPNHDRTRVLEANMEMRFIGEILNGALKTADDVVAIGLFSPRGDALGSVDSRGEALLAKADFDPRAVSFAKPLVSGDGFVFFTQVPTTVGDCCECRTKGLASPDGSYYYVLRTEVSRRTLDRQLSGIRSWFLRIGVLALLLSGLVASFVSRRLVSQLSEMGARVREIAESSDWSLRLRMPGGDEVAQLAGEFDRMLERLKYGQTQLAAAAKEKALLELARQVAHDIRSPLVALDAVIGDIARLPVGQRTIVRGAVGRIRDIANDLLSRSGAGAAAIGGEPADACLLSSLLDSLLTEKRLQYRSRGGVEIEGLFDAASYGLFARVRPVEFQRLVSNLVNNGVEALDGAGKVSLRLIGDGDRVRLQVTDDGRGIPPELLDKLGRRGETHGKAGGSGLGLHHARSAVESWGGSLELSSGPGRGTTAVVSVLRAHPPRWFVSVLELAPRLTVVALDDDASVHEVWRARFETARTAERGVELLHFSTTAELRAWAGADPERARGALYLIDYELPGSDNGLSLAAELGLGERAILVTSRFEEKAVLDECLRLGASMIPKGLVNLVPIRFVAEAGLAAAGRERWDAVLIDDDPLVRMTWKLSAAKFGKRLRAYRDAAEFLAESAAIDRGTPVYVDAELADGANGDDEARRIRGLGFHEVYLATGHEPGMFSGSTHLRGVVGKEPPWSGDA